MLHKAKSDLSALFRKAKPNRWRHTGAVDLGNSIKSPSEKSGGLFSSKLPIFRWYNLLTDEHSINLSDASSEYLGKFATLDKGYQNLGSYLS
jgi:hypothetical protein